ncbi:MAG: hypothetical protein ABI668_08185 [Sphingorhabdus sp.]
MRNLAVVAVVALSIVTGCSRKEPADPAAIKALMTQKVQPVAVVYWNAVQYISDETGTREIRPETDADWNRTIEAARSLKQLGEELKLPANAAGRGTDWQDFAQGLVDAAGQAEQAARSRSPEKVLEAGGTVYNVCSACHEVYMPSPTGLSPVVEGTNRPSH